MSPTFLKATVARLLPLVGTCAVAFPQDLEPRRWTHMPVDTNVLALGYSFSKGNLNFDPVLRIEEADVELHTAVVSYSRYFRLFDTTARFDAHVPFQAGRWEGLVDGAPTSVRRDGMADPVFRLSANLTGAPPLRGKELRAYQEEHTTNTAVGAALEVRVPLGEYMEDKLINLGQNRFVIVPQLGVLHRREEWSFELTGSTFFYTDNDEFFNDSKLEQDPFFAVQTHVVKTFEGGYWLSAGMAYGWAGESSINGVSKNDDKSNLLWGASFGFRIGATQGVRLAYVRGDALTNIGSDTHSVLVGWSIRF